MSSHTSTTQALENMTDFVAFERLCCDLLSCYGNYVGVVPQGVGRIDHGKDALLIKRASDSVSCMLKKVVFHFSLRKDYKRKLWEDLESIKRNELNPTEVVFITSQVCSAVKKDELKEKVKSKYCWDLEIYDQEWLRIPLDTTFQNLRRIYLGLDFDLTIFARLHDLLENINRHPNRLDFEQGVYYRDDTLHKAINYWLKNKSQCLIIGKPGSGKTALALGIGYEFIKENPQNMVFYIASDKKPFSDNWIKQIKQSDHPYVLYIIDDCHKEIDAVNDFVTRRNEIKNAKVLLISRSIHPDITGTTEESYLEILKPETIPIVVERETVLQIIRNIGKREDISAEEIGDTEIILEKCEGDLHLLNFYVDAWIKEKTRFMYLSEVDEKTVLDNVYRLYLRNKQNTEQLLSIAALSQFEIPVEDRFVGNYEVIESILTEAWVEKSIREILGIPIIFLQYFHSTPANYLLKAAFEKGILDKSLGDYTIEKLENYLQYKSTNFFDVFTQLYINDRIDLQYALFQKEETFNLYKEIVNINQLHGISKFLLGVFKWEERKKDGKASQLLQILQETIKEKECKEFFKNEPVKKIITSLLLLDKINSKFIINILPLLDLKQLGKRLLGVNPATVLSSLGDFLQRISQVGVEKTKLKAFCDELDFRALGERSKNAGLSSLQKFIRVISQVGVEKTKLKTFCDELDFRALGERSQDGGMTVMMHFIRVTSQVGVEKTKLKAFCDELDFRALGERSQDAGLSSLGAFLQRISQVGVEKTKLKTFCDELDFRALGEKSNDTGLYSVIQFILRTSRLEVENRKLKIFYAAINWKKLGQSVIDEKGIIRNLLFPSHMLLNVKGITKDMARNFVEGIGWENLRNEIKENMSPDVLAVTRILLIKKCGLRLAELKEMKIDLRARLIWFRSFTGNRCPRVEERQEEWREYYLTYALNRLMNLNVEKHLRTTGMSLKAWNIFINNMLLAEPTYIDSTIVPILRSLSRNKYENLFSQSELLDISIFLHRFNPKDGIFKWTLPNEIGFLRSEFKNDLEESTLSEIAHFIFNFYFIGRDDCSNFYAKFIEKHQEQFLERVEKEDLKDVVFFLWNLWMALPEGEKPSLLQYNSFINMLLKKTKQEKKDQENILGLIGIMNLCSSKVPTELAEMVKLEPAKQLCINALKAESIKSIYLLSGLLTILNDISEDEKEDYLNFLKGMDFYLEVPNQIYALNQLRSWLLT